MTGREPKSRLKIAVRFGVTLVAIVGGLVGLILTYKALHDWHFLRIGDSESLAICTDSPHMDCDPRGWGPILIFGLGLALLGLVIALRFGLALVRDCRSHKEPNS